MRRTRLGALALALAPATAHAGAQDIAVAGDPGAEEKARTLLAEHCHRCHSSEARKLRGGLRVDSRAALLEGGVTGPAVVPGDPNGSLLVRALRSTEADLEMPPDGPLAADEIATIAAWIASGAPWSEGESEAGGPPGWTDGRLDHWSFQPVERPDPPEVRRKDWSRNPIDHFVLARLEANELAPSPEADRRTLLRRATLDLTGLPPTVAEMAAFLADDAPHAFERVVDRLLASPKYGERQARHWLDVVRFGESNGFEHDELRPNAWPYRDWVVDALNADLPYDEFARLQIAGDVLAPEEGGIEATGFLAAGPYDLVGQSQQGMLGKEIVRQDELEDLVGTTGSAFLGLTVRCARCHDHRFDPILQSEYFALAAALDGVRQGTRDRTPPSERAALDAAVERTRDLRDRLQEELLELESSAYDRAAAAGLDEAQRAALESAAPMPLARWDFEGDLNDSIGALHGKKKGHSRVADGALVLGDKVGYVATSTLEHDITEKTLEAWVRLDDLAQSGGGALTLQTLNGSVFDAIVYGEREPRHWIAGSDSFRRTRDVGGVEERVADARTVHVAAVYDADGTVTLYRDGRPYGEPYATDGPVRFEAGKAEILIGMRHERALATRQLHGAVLRAQLFGRALTPDEVAASMAAGPESVGTERLVAAMSPAERERHARVQVELEDAKAEYDALLISAEQRPVRAVVPREPVRKTQRLARGDPRRPAEVVAPGGVAALVGVGSDFGLWPDSPEADRRRALADWITHERSPLFARVAVNRMWQHHFGTGIVATPSDLGVNGAQPSHPGLLDWLASELAAHGYSAKALHRLIVTSATYRQDSAYDAAAAEVDAGSRLLWRMPPRRLDAEVLRDSMLAAAARLDDSMGGPGYRDFEATVRGSTYTYSPIPWPDELPERRTLYRTWVRGGEQPFLDAFDCPDPSAAAPRRAATTTPLQSLAILHDDLVLRSAASLARRIEDESLEGERIEAAIARAFQLVYQRDPEPPEVEAACELVEAHGLASLGRALFASNEFQVVD